MGITFFDSPGLLATMAEQRGQHKSFKGDESQRPEWYGGESWNDAIRLTRGGNDSLVPKARDLLDKFSHLVDIRQREYIPDLAGAYPIVPEAIAGFPYSMRRRVEVSSESAPVSVYVNVTLSYDVTAEQAQRKGVAVLALVWALSLTRPVSLSTIWSAKGTKQDDCESVIVTRLETAPLDLATACYCLTSTGYARHMNYNVGSHLHGYHSNWPEGYDPSNPDKYHESLRPRLLAGPDDLFLRPVYSGDLAITDTEKWLREHLERFNSRDDS